MSDNNQLTNSWMTCSRCGKKLLKRLPNGLFELRFGALFPKRDLNKLKEISRSDYPFQIEKVIELKIHGSISIKCTNRQCRLEDPDHRNTFNFLPF